jgi:hypothetical protein
MEPKLAYLAQGKLFYRENGTSRPIESQYGQDVVRRALERQAKNEWKSEGQSSSALFSRQSLWGAGNNVNAINVRVTTVVPGKSEDELIYVVSTESVGGLFVCDLKANKETRLFHKEKLYLSDMSRQPDGELLLCALKLTNGTSRIAVVDGNAVNEITEGDSIDECPSWVAGGGKKIVYQSAGVARNPRGIMVGVGNSCIQKLDLSSGALDTVVEKDDFDYLTPKMTAQGDLFAIRRPYEAPFKRSYPAHKILLDVLLFPFRLGRAIFSYLNFFSLTFSQKPLTTASGPKIEGLDEKMLFLRGRLIDTELTLQKQAKDADAPSLVPKTWQLIRRDASGKETVLTDSVLSFDFGKDGSIVYTTGISVFHMNADGSGKKVLFKDKLVDTVVVLDNN